LDSSVDLSAPAKNGGSDLSTRTSEAIASNASIALAIRSRLLETSVSNKACRAWFLALRVRFADIDRDPDIAAPFARASGLADGPETTRRVAQRSASQRGTSPVRSAASTPTGGCTGL